MSKKYINIVNKNNKKARKRVKIPSSLQDYMTNVTLDLKGVQNSLVKIETIKWQSYQIFDSMKQIIRILREKQLLGKYEDWEDIMCNDCHFKRKMVEHLIKAESYGVITGDGEFEEITFAMGDWKKLIGKVNDDI